VAFLEREETLCSIVKEKIKSRSFQRREQRGSVFLGEGFLSKKYEKKESCWYLTQHLGNALIVGF
jgi:hypothetical protein